MREAVIVTLLAGGAKWEEIVELVRCSRREIAEVAKLRSEAIGALRERVGRGTVTRLNKAGKTALLTLERAVNEMAKVNPGGLDSPKAVSEFTARALYITTGLASLYEQAEKRARGELMESAKRMLRDGHIKGELPAPPSAPPGAGDTLAELLKAQNTRKEAGSDAIKAGS